MVDIDYEQRVRAACFVAIGQMQHVHGDVLSIDVIRRGVVIDGERIALVNPYKGIHQPRQLNAALAVTTTPPASTKDAPYDDRMGDDGLYVYHYRTAGSDSRQAHQQAERDNASVRYAREKGLELIYWHGVVPGQYLPFFPVRVVGEDAASRTFSLDLTGLAGPSLQDVAAEAPSRRYRSSVVTVRMHQARFRAQVLRAYAGACAVCRLRRAELVDAAHIVTDAQGGEPVVQNGLALCRLHHAAFDRNIMGVSPDLVVHIRRDILREVDGPMLVHGLQGFHEVELSNIPRRTTDRPGSAFLEQRWEEFRATS
jgi:putative restriction endonuclease